jgi:hypothetical protein
MPLSGLANSIMPNSFLSLSVYAPFRYGKYAILPNSFLPLSIYAPFRFGKYLIVPNSFMPLSFMLLSVYASFRLCSFPFMPLSGLMEIIDYAGFLYANFRRPLKTNTNRWNWKLIWKRVFVWFAKKMLHAEYGSSYEATPLFAQWSLREPNQKKFQACRWSETHRLVSYKYVSFINNMTVPTKSSELTKEWLTSELLVNICWAMET